MHAYTTKTVIINKVVCYARVCPPCHVAAHVSSMLLRRAFYATAPLLRADDAARYDMPRCAMRAR